MTIRPCLRTPIAEIYEAADLLSAAVDAHISGNPKEAARLISLADISSIREFTESVWGAGARIGHGFVTIEGSPPSFSLSDRPLPRMPIASTKRAVIERDGYHCRFCEMPVIPAAVRKRIQGCYPHELSWGRANSTQHAAFQCMWLQFDHVVPNSRGGSSDLDNVVVTCAPCNFGRMEMTLGEAMLLHPLSRPDRSRWRGFSGWDGLVRFQ